jgi:FecR protein
MSRVAIMVMAAVAAFGQTQSQLPPWSEQPPLAQQAPYPQQRPPYAQPPQYGGSPAPSSLEDQGYAPNRGVARISYMTGNVSVRRGDSGELVAAILNAPLTIGDRIVTGDNGRAEVQLDFSNVIRIGPSSEVRLSDLEQGRYQYQIAMGTTSFRVLRDANAQVEISTPSVAVHPLRKGIYRVNVKPDGGTGITTEITVRGGGDAEIASPTGTEVLHSGQTMLARGPANDPEFQVVAVLPADEFDSWAASRDKLLLSSRSPQYVNHGAYGAEDLDQYGQWQPDPSNPQYGNVWVPQQDPGWAPYQCGRWTWVDFYGWTWVGCEPWAWAPYHYGSWYYGGFGWAWYPGPLFAPLFWRPAMVGFFGFGAPGFGVGFGFGFGFGALGWVPLAPGEIFHPWYGAGFYGGFRGLNVVGGTNVGALYRNARVTTGVSAMRAGDFGRGSVSAAGMVRPTSAEMAHAGSVRGQLPVAPTRESTQFTNHAANTAGMPRSSDATHFAGRAAASTPRMSFDAQARSFGSASRGISGGASAGARGGGAGAANGGWSHFDPSTRPAGAGANRPGYSGSSPYSRGGQAQGGARSGGQQPVRVNPSIVQQSRSGSNSAARPSGGGARGGGGGHGGGGRR